MIRGSKFNNHFRFPIYGTLPCVISIRRWYRLRLLDGHFLVAAGECAFTGFCGEGLCPTDLAFISFSRVYLAFVFASLLFDCHRLITTRNGPVSAAGDNHFGAAFRACISFSHCVSHWSNLLICLLQLDLFEIRRDDQFRFRDRLNVFRGKSRINFLKRNPSGVTSITARSVKIFWTFFFAVAG